MKSQWTLDEKLILNDLQLITSYITISLESIDYGNIGIFLKNFFKSDRAIELYILIIYIKFSKKIEKSKKKMIWR